MPWIWSDPDGRIGSWESGSRVFRSESASGCPDEGMTQLHVDRAALDRSMWNLLVSAVLTWAAA
jgi:hypothetical protein